MNQKISKKLAIRVSTDSNYGKGHISRCLAIRSHIKCKTVWYIDLKDNEVTKMIPQYDEIVIEDGVFSCLKIKNAIKNNYLSMVLLDSYMISNNEHLKIKKNIPLVVISDSLKKVNADLTIYPHPVSYNFSKNKNFLGGVKYALISKNYKAGGKIKDCSRKEFNILVSMGSIDKARVTVTAIKSLNKILRNSSHKIKILIVLGIKSPLKVDVKSLTSSVKDYEILINPNDMRVLYLKSSLAIGAPGQSHLERMVFGLPTILVSQNKLHKPIISEWERLGCGIQSDNTVSSLYKNICFLLSNRAILNKMKISSKMIVDGLGASRVASTMSKMI